MARVKPLKTRRAIAICAAGAEDEVTYKVGKIATGESYLVSAHALLRYVGWPVGTPARSRESRATSWWWNC